MLTGRCTPVRGLNSFLASCDVQRATSLLRLGVAQAAREDRRRDQQSSIRGLCIFACVARYRGTEIPIFLAHHCKDDAFADLVLHITPKSEHATEKCSIPFVFGRAVVDALPPQSVQASATRHCAGPVRLLEQWTVRPRESHEQRRKSRAPSSSGSSLSASRGERIKFPNCSKPVLYAPAPLSLARFPLLGAGMRDCSFDQLETQQLTRCGFSRERLEAGASVIHALFDKRLYRSRIFLGGEQNPPVLRLDVGLELCCSCIVTVSSEDSQPCSTLP